MMLYLRTGILLSIVALGLEALLFGPPDPHAGTLMCVECHNAKNHFECTGLVNCEHGEHVCYTQVTSHSNGEYFITKGCKHEKECHEQELHVLGKRLFVDRLQHTVCKDCCASSQCNTFGCDSYLTTTTTKPTTITTLAPCRDHEGDGFTCADYDLSSFCTDSSGFAHKLAYDRCPKHCGFCDSNGNYLVSTMSMVPTTTTTTTAGTVCRDDEDSNFTCATWASYGFCLNIPGSGHDVAVKRCSKYCGFCS